MDEEWDGRFVKIANCFKTGNFLMVDWGFKLFSINLDTKQSEESNSVIWKALYLNAVMSQQPFTVFIFLCQVGGSLKLF